MKPDIHPNYKALSVTCNGCGNQFVTQSTMRKDEFKLEVCNACHPFFTKQYRIVDTAGKVESFLKRYNQASSQAESKETGSK